MMVSAHRVLTGQYVVVLQLDLHYFIEVQDRFVRAADLERVIDHPMRLAFP